MFELFYCCQNKNSGREIKVISKDNLITEKEFNSSKRLNDITKIHSLKENINKLNSSENLNNVNNKENKLNQIDLNLKMKNILKEDNKNEIEASYITVGDIKFNKNEDKKSCFYDTQIINSKFLKLSGVIFWDKEIVIDKLGIKSKKRNEKNLTTFFSIKNDKMNNNSPLKTFVLNLINIPNNILENNNTIFSIKYDINDDNFIMKNLSKNIKIFNKINYTLFLEKNSDKKFLLGKMFVKIKTTNKDKENKVHINIKSENEQPKNFTFENIQLPISIGRSSSTINIKNNSISKTHCIIDFSNEYQKYFIKDNKSTNGTYLILEENDSILLNGEMKFRIFETKFTIEENENMD